MNSVGSRGGPGRTEGYGDGCPPSRALRPAAPFRSLLRPDRIVVSAGGHVPARSWIPRARTNLHRDLSIDDRRVTPIVCSADVDDAVAADARRSPDRNQLVDAPTHVVTPVEIVIPEDA